MIVRDIIQSFNTKMRDWVSAQVQYKGSTPVNLSAVVWEGTPGYTDVSTINWTKTIYYNTTAGVIAANSLANGGSPNSIFTEDPDINAIINVTDFEENIDKPAAAVPYIISSLKNLLILYSKAHRIAMQNNGNIVTSAFGGIGLSSNIPANLVTEIPDAVDAQITSTRANNGNPLDEVLVNRLFEMCKNIWTQKCSSVGALETFRFNFCHNSCHSNNTCYNSRGRR